MSPVPSPSPLPPVCVLPDQTLGCAGVDTTVVFDGSGSSDPDGDIQQYNWSYDCLDVSNVTLVDTGSSGGASSSLAITLADPGQGVDVQCEVTLEVVDGDNLSATCNAMVDITRCELDCAGTIRGTAELDPCGVCEGDGTSCLDCADSDISGTQLTVDGLSFEQRNVVHNAIRIFRKTTGKRNALRSLYREANQLYRDNWTLIWSVPSVQLSCTNAVSPACVTTSNVDILNQVSGRTDRLQQIGNAVVRRILRVTSKRKVTRRARRLRKRLGNVTDTASAELENIPQSTTSCSPSS